MKNIALLALSLALVPYLGAADPVVTPEPPNLELAHQVIKAMHADKIFDQMSAQMQQIAAQSVNENSANMTPQQRAIATKVSSEVTVLSMDFAKGLLGKMDVIYAQVYSEAELKAMKAFFESPEGISMIQKQPQIMQKLMPYVSEMQKELGPKIKKITEDARAEEQAVAAAAPTPPAAAEK
jgi:uncharacterized protein